jgi:hypothetical protein
MVDPGFRAIGTMHVMSHWHGAFSKAKAHGVAIS